MNGNHHREYRDWCLALWLVRRYPIVERERLMANAKSHYERRDIEKMPARLLRRAWLDRYQERHGAEPAKKLMDAARKIHADIAAGREPEYDGPYKPATRGTIE